MRILFISKSFILIHFTAAPIVIGVNFALDIQAIKVEQDHPSNVEKLVTADLPAVVATTHQRTLVCRQVEIRHYKTLKKIQS